MKTILVATDFSKAGDNAAFYAADLAGIFNARLILFSAYQQVLMAVPEAPVLVSTEDVHKDVESQLADTAARLSRNAAVQIVTCSKVGSATHAILDAVAAYQPDLVIVGMKQHGKALRRLFGSTVTQLIRKLQVPLLVIPEEVSFRPIHAIALANDGDLPDDTNPYLLDALRELAERFRSKLYLARVVNQPFNEAYEVVHKPVRLSRMIRVPELEFKCIQGEDVSEALTGFIKQRKIDVLAMLPHNYSLLERWFISSVTREMAFTTPVPLLVLPNKNIESTN